MIVGLVVVIVGAALAKSGLGMLSLDALVPDRTATNLQKDAEMLKDHLPVWGGWKGAGGTVIRSFTILTTTAYETLCRLHDRMPVGTGGYDLVRRKEDPPR